jgi:FAD synthase
MKKRPLRRSIPTRRRYKRVYRNHLVIHGLPPRSHFSECGGAVLTFGVFDGFHGGQRAMVQQVRDRAAEIGAKSAVLVFRPRPSEALNSALAQPYFSALDETLRLIKAIGVDYAGSLKFTRRLALTSSPDFLRAVMAHIPIRELWLGPEALVGRGPEGRLEFVADFGLQNGFSVHVFHAPKTVLTAGFAEDFEAGNIRALFLHLGRAYRLPGYVTSMLALKENGLVRFSLIVPTRLHIPPDGNYAVEVRPAFFENAKPVVGSSPGRAVLVIKTSRIEIATPELTVIAPASRGWTGSFVTVDFLDALKSSPGELWHWATRPARGEMLPVEYRGNVRSALES